MNFKRFSTTALATIFVFGCLLAFSPSAYAQKTDSLDQAGKTWYDAEKTKRKEVYQVSEKVQINPDGTMATKYIKQGPYFLYYENGKVKEEGKYASDLKDGTWKYFDDKGKLLKTERYDKGKLVK